MRCWARMQSTSSCSSDGRLGARGSKIRCFAWARALHSTVTSLKGKGRRICDRMYYGVEERTCNKVVFSNALVLVAFIVSKPLEYL